MALAMIDIIRKIIHFPLALRSSILFEESWNLVSIHKYNEAELKFEKAERAMKRLPIEYKIMKGHIKFRLDKRYDCYDIYQSAWRDIDQDKRLSYADKLYLKWYMYSAISIYDKYLDMGNRKKLGPISAEDVPLAEVSSTWKRRFPSRDHPDWDKYGA